MADGAYGVVYRVTHRESGRVYIGQTIQELKKRWHDHQRQTYCARLYRAIRKYGADAFSVDVIATAQSKNALDLLESFWIRAYQATDRGQGFNLRDGGSFGKHTAESRAKMSARVQAKLLDKAYREKLSQSKMGRKVSQETRDRISKAHQGKIVSEATREVLSERRKAMWQDPEWRKKILEAQAVGKAKARSSKT